MDQVEILLKSLEPHIEKKCAELRQRKDERLFAHLFLALSGLILVLPVVLIFFGVSVMMIFLPVLFVAAVILTALSVFISKGAVYDEQISCMD